MSLGNKIFELRKKNNLSQEQLGEQVNVTRQTIVIKILKFLEIAFAALFAIDLIALILFAMFKFVG